MNSSLDLLTVVRRRSFGGTSLFRMEYHLNHIPSSIDILSLPNILSPLSLLITLTILSSSLQYSTTLVGISHQATVPLYSSRVGKLWPFQRDVSLFRAILCEISKRFCGQDLLDLEGQIAPIWIRHLTCVTCVNLACSNIQKKLFLYLDKSNRESHFKI